MLVNTNMNVLWSHSSRLEFFSVFLSLFFPSVLMLSGGAVGQVFLDTLLFGKICVPGLQPSYMLVTLEIKSCSI